MTQQEIQALIALLNRTPMTLAEQLWVQVMIGKLATAREPTQEASPAA